MEEQIIITKVEKPNSFEIGKSGMRQKIYYNEISELQSKLLKLEELGLIDLIENGIDVNKLKVVLEK